MRRRPAEPGAGPMREGVLIAGLGAVSAAGADVASTLESFRTGRVRPTRAPDLGFVLGVPVFAAPVPVAPGRSRTLALALRAAREALSAAGRIDGLDARRIGVCMGTTVACQLNDVDFYAAFRASMPPAMEAVDRYLQGDLATVVARRLGFKRESVTPQGSKLRSSAKVDCGERAAGTGRRKETTGDFRITRGALLMRRISLR